jgi:hypothetical protein
VEAAAASPSQTQAATRAAALIQVSRLAEQLDVERGEKDVVVIGEEAMLNGTASCNKISVRTQYGLVTVPWDAVAAVRPARGKAAGEVYLRTGEVLAGLISTEGLTMKVDDDLTFKVALGGITALVRKVSPADGIATDGTGAFLTVRSGDRIAIKPSPSQLIASTAWGPFKISFSDIALLSEGRAPHPMHWLIHRDRSRLSAFLPRDDVQLESTRFGKITVALADVKKFGNIEQLPLAGDLDNINVTVREVSSNEHEIWAGKDPTPVGSGNGISKIKVKRAVRADRIRVYLRTSAIGSWTEVDAVAVQDPQGKIHWAKTGRASSTYSGSSSTYSAMQATGPPNVPSGGDNGNAWCPGSTSQDQWLEVGYEKPLTIREVHVFENYNPGAVYRITAVKPTRVAAVAYNIEDDDRQLPHFQIHGGNILVGRFADDRLEIATELGTQSIKTKSIKHMERHESGAVFLFRTNSGAEFTGRLGKKPIRISAASRVWNIPPHHVLAFLDPQSQDAVDPAPVQSESTKAEKLQKTIEALVQKHATVTDAAERTKLEQEIQLLRIVLRRQKALDKDN